MTKRLLLLSPLLLLAACSTEPEPAAELTPGEANTAGAPFVMPVEAASASPNPSPTASANTLTLAGLGDLRIGEAVPAGSRWGEDSGQASDECRTISSPDYPGAYAIVEQGKVRRITVGQRSAVELVEGIGVGASEKDVLAWFPFTATPHEYEEAPAKYLTAPNADSGDPALRFEVGQDGKVSLIHVGTMPVLGYVEGCA